MFGAATESSERILNKSANETVASKDDKPSPVKGHGRNSARDYTGAKKVYVAHECLKHGDKCPGCGRGKLYHIDPGILMNCFAAAPIQAIIYLLEKLRCNLCGGIYTAEKPPEAGSIPKFLQIIHHELRHWICQSEQNAQHCASRIV